MSDVDTALRALSQSGWWIRDACADGELIRVELRLAARRRGIRLRTGITDTGVLWATTPDGLCPAPGLMEPIRWLAAPSSD